MKRTRAGFAVAIALGIGLSAFAEDTATPLQAPDSPLPAIMEVYTTAVLPFTESGTGVAGFGEQAQQLLAARLSNNPSLWLVERSDLDKIMKEFELNLSGAVDPSKATAIGQITGAKLIVTGSVFKIKDNTFIVGKIISTESSRVMAKSVDGTQALDDLLEQLSTEINECISKDASKLIPKIKEKKEVIAELKNKIGDNKKPKLCIKIEERHVSQPAIDPAAQTEFQIICKELGFELTTSENDADILVKGEGFSEFAGRRGNLIFVKARLEIQALDKKGKIIAADRQICTETDLTELIAGKKALQEASAKIAERIIPKIVKNN